MASQTFSEVDVRCLVQGPIRVLKVTDQRAYGLLAGGDQVDRLHRGQGLSVLMDVLHHWKNRDEDVSANKESYPMGIQSSLTSYSLCTDVMHLTARRDHPHGQLVNDQDTPLDVLFVGSGGRSCFPGVRGSPLEADHLVHDL